MFDYLVLGLFAGLFFGVFSFVLLYQLMKFMKGNMKISIPRKQFFYGETLRGSLRIKAKKHIEVENIQAYLIGYKRQRVYTNSRTQTKNVEVFKKVFSVSEKDVFMAGTQRDIPLTVEIPKVGEFSIELQDMISEKTKIVDSFNKHHKTPLNTGRLRWKLRIDMHAEGVDLTVRESLELQVPNT